MTLTNNNKRQHLRLLDHDSAAAIINRWYDLNPGDFTIDATDDVSYVPGKREPAAAILIKKADGTSTLITATLMQSPAPAEYIAQD